MTWLDALSGRYLELYAAPGIDWSLYDEQGVLMSNPSYSYRDEVLGRVTRLYDVVGSFTAELRDRYRVLRADEGREALTQLWSSIQEDGAEVWDAAMSGDAAAASSATITMAKDGYTDAVLSLAAYVADGAGLHLSLVMDDALLAGSVTLEELREHADRIVRMCDAFVLVDQEGGFDELKTAGTAGMGVAWFAALPAGAWVAISVVGIAAVLGLAYMLHGVFVTLPIQKKTIDTCERLAQQGLIASSERCFEQMPNPPMAAPWEAPLKTLSYVVIGGVALYAVSLALPHLLRARREARA